MFGKLSWDAIPFNQPIPMAASLGVILAIAAIIALVLFARGTPEHGEPTAPPSAVIQVVGA